MRIQSFSSELMKQPLVRGFLLVCAFGIALTWADKPTYWPSMLTAYLVASLIYLYNARKSPGKSLSLRNSLFPKDVWMHHSTTQDIIMTFISFVLITQVLHHIVIDPNMFLGFINSIMNKLSLVTYGEEEPSAVVIILYVISTILASDMFYYFSHRITHKVPILWEFHKVHHSGKVLTPLTVFRLHPLDVWFNQCFRNVGKGLVAGVFFYFYPTTASLFIIASTIVGAYFFHFLLTNLQHSHMWISFGSRLEHIFISPAQHQIHHSTNPRHFDKNFGSMLALWDWAFGSLYVPKEREQISFGLGGHSHEDEEIHASVWKMYVMPIKKFIRWVIG